MIAFAHALILAARMHAAYPELRLERVGAAAMAAVLEETPYAPAALLAAIAEHESGLEPRTVSWRARGRRVDILWTSVAEPPRSGVMYACGLASTIASTRDDCAALMDPRAAMRAGAAELGEHRKDRACRRSLRCALSSYAGGRRGIDAWRRDEITDATVFADGFIRRAEQLGNATDIIGAIMASEFSAHMLNDNGVAKATRIATAFDALLAELDACGVDARERVLAVTYLQTACFFAKRSIACKPENQE